MSILRECNPLISGSIIAIIVVAVTASGCGRTSSQIGTTFGAIPFEVGEHRRSEVLEAMGPPQLFDVTRAGEVGSDYLVYEYRETTTWSVGPLFMSHIMNTERTQTMVFYFDEDGILKDMGYEEGRPTTRRSASVLFGQPIVLGRDVK